MYKDINEIEARKEELRKALLAKENEIATLWDTVFNPPSDTGIETPSQRILHYAHNAAGVFDGAMLGWKLYKRLNGSFLFRKHKRH